jgi:hypothetical protein
MVVVRKDLPPPTDYNGEMTRHYRQHGGGVVLFSS